MPNRKERIEKFVSTALRSNQLAINRLRSYLNDYLDGRFPDSRGRYIAAAEDILFTCKEKIDHETLKRFTENINLRNRNKDFNSGKSKLIVITEYLTSPEIDFVSLEELEDSSSTTSQLPFRLLDFFGFREAEDISQYSGAYENSDVDDRSKIIELHISNINSQPVFHVYTLEYQNRAAREGWKTDRSRTKSPLSFSGWAVFVKRNLLLIILRSNGQLKSRIYLSVAKSDFYSSNRVKILRLFLHNGLASLGDDTKKELLKKYYEFQRIEDFSSTNRKDMSIMNNGDDQLSPEELQKRKEEARKKLSGQRRLSRGELNETAIQRQQKDEREIMSKKDLSKNEKEILGSKLVDAAFILDEDKVRNYITQGADINYIDEESGATAMHFLAGHSRVDGVDFLLGTGRCNLLIRDKQGRLPSGCAAEITGNMELRSRLRNLELQQGTKLGLTQEDLYNPPRTPGPIEPRTPDSADSHTPGPK